MTIEKAEKIIKEGVPEGYIVEFFVNNSSDMSDQVKEILPENKPIEYDRAKKLAEGLASLKGDKYFEIKLVYVPTYRVVEQF